MAKVIEVSEMKKFNCCFIAIVFSLGFKSYGAPGFMDAQAGLLTIVNSIVVVEWTLVLIALLFFRYHRKSVSKKIKFTRWLSVLVPVFIGFLAAFLLIKSSEIEFSRLFYSTIILVGVVVLGVPALIFAVVHSVSSIIQKFYPHRDAWVYNFVLLVWITVPAVLVGSAYLSEASISRQTAEIRNEVKSIIMECCSGKADSCIKASERFDFLGKLNQSNTQFYEMKRKYMAQACQKGDKESCNQFYYHTGYKKYKEHELYTQPCDANDADIPMYRPKDDCC